MRVPLKWLKEFVDPGMAPEALAHRLTMAGLEAEKIEVVGAGWDNVFVGRVENVLRHPDADRLVLATVVAGEHRLTVVTGAPNIAAGQIVPLALAGARLFDGHAEGWVLKTLKPGTIRGVRSEGMVCSEKELGLSDEHEGIMVLPADAPVGTTLQEYLGDTVIEFEITPNLVHAFSVLGIAREVAALVDQPLRLPDAMDLHATPAGDADLARIEDPTGAKRLTATVIEGITVGPSPHWLRRRLELAGSRAINNVVDVTNYVMLEWGNPTHAYDRDKLAGGGIVARRARPGETIETLDHQVRQLSPEVLVIADAERPVGVAGVIGGLDSEVSDATTTVLLEVANFDMKVIRAGTKALKVRTDGSARWERGIDPNLASQAAGRAIRLLLDLCPGSRVTAAVDLYPAPLLPRDLLMPFAEIERLLGIAYEPPRVLDALTRLGFEAELGDDGELRVTVPTWRSDVTHPADVVEEVARSLGYETLPETLPRGETAPVRRDPLHKLGREVGETLIAAGGFETVTYVTVGEGHLAPFADDSGSGFLHRVAPAGQPSGQPNGQLSGQPRGVLRLRNPLQNDRPVLRPTLVPSLLEVAAANLRHERGVRLFEVARVYLPSDGELPDEKTVVGILMAGKRDPLDRYRKPEQSRSDGATHEPDEYLDFFDLKGAVEAVLARARVEARFAPLLAPAPGLHPGRSAEVLAGERRIGLLGELRPDVAAGFGIEAPRVAVAELDLNAMMELATPLSGVTVPRFLPVEQDFAVVVAEETAAGAVEAALLAGAGPLATGIALFDVYRGPQVGEGRKSLAYRITFTAPDRALTDAELTKVRDRIGKALKQRVQGELRG
jgi:phenylalanyl-tRNA synthetase beta chain